jgi:hypothetical protein
MIIEDERHINEVKRGDYEQFNATTLDLMSHSPTFEFMDFIRRHHQLETEKLIHNSNQTLWSICGNYIPIPRLL